MGLIERIKSALGLGTSASTGASPSSTPDRQSGSDEDAGPTPVSEVDEQVEGAQTVVDPADADDVDVTVEHEPDASSEKAVKASDAAATGADADVEPADGEEPSEPSADVTDDAAEADADEPAEDAGDATEDSRAGVDLEEIKGIGPAYADRLREAGVEDVADLAAADAADLADRTDLGEGRVGKWIERAGAR
jgi:predicted flap endonuclease-1-like 5' DNA nuclease